MTEFVPTCMLGIRYRRADELTLSRVISVSDLSFTESNWRRTNEGVFYEACRECDLRKFCCGVHPVHHEEFGERSCFTPISVAGPD